MAVCLLSHGVSDLCIGRPALRTLPCTATVADALAALKAAGEPHIAVVSAALEKKAVIAGRIGFADVVCYLCSDENIRSPAAALQRPVSVLFPKEAPDQVCHAERGYSIVEALDVILEGAQVLVVPIRSAGGRKKLHYHGSVAGATTFSDHCLITQEDFVRYFLNSIAIFSPVATLSVDQLGLIRSADALTIRHDDPAVLAVPLIRRAIAEQTAVAVAGNDGKLLGEISPFALAYCDEKVAAAIATLSAGDLMAYIENYCFPPEVVIRAIKSRLKEKNLKGILALIKEESSMTNCSSASSSSSDEESGSERRSARLRRRTYTMARRSEDTVVCHRESSLVAVMVQALAHRLSYLWVVDEEDDHLIGIVTFVDVLKIFREHLHQ